MSYNWHTKIRDLAAASKARKDTAKAELDEFELHSEQSLYNLTFDIDWEASTRLVSDYKKHVDRLSTEEFHMYTKFAQKGKAQCDEWRQFQPLKLLRFLLWYHARSSINCNPHTSECYEHQLAMSKVLISLVQMDTEKQMSELKRVIGKNASY